MYAEIKSKLRKDLPLQLETLGKTWRQANAVVTMRSLKEPDGIDNVAIALKPVWDILQEIGVIASDRMNDLSASYQWERSADNIVQIRIQER